jgi:hypothetical protein
LIDVRMINTHLDIYTSTHIISTHTHTYIHIYTSSTYMVYGVVVYVHYYYNYTRARRRQRTEFEDRGVGYDWEMKRGRCEEEEGVSTAPEKSPRLQSQSAAAPSSPFRLLLDQVSVSLKHAIKTKDLKGT